LQLVEHFGELGVADATFLGNLSPLDERHDTLLLAALAECGVGLGSSTGHFFHPPLGRLDLLSQPSAACSSAPLP